MGSALPEAAMPACNLELATLPPELATLLGKEKHYLRNKHLIPMVGAGQLRFRYPESAKHPNQAYVTPGAEGTSTD
jgi:ATP-dependent DNA helicase RecG